MLLDTERDIDVEFLDDADRSDVSFPTECQVTRDFTLVGIPDRNVTVLPNENGKQSLEDGNSWWPTNRPKFVLGWIQSDAGDVPEGPEGELPHLGVGWAKRRSILLLFFLFPLGRRPHGKRLSVRGAAHHCGDDANGPMMNFGD
jgi:hypothetical protein